MMKHRVLNILVPILFAAALVWGYFNVLPTPANAQDGSTPINPENIQNGYSDAPMLAARVAAGQLPPVGERLLLEENIVVITPVDGVGIYGGIWHDVTPWGDYGPMEMILYDPPVRWKADYSGYEPGLLKSWDLSTDGMTLTWHLRQGLKWSDGVLFTSEDLQFWWEDLALNESVDNVDVPWWGFNSDGSPMAVTFPTSMTMIMNWDEPNYISPYFVAQGYWEWQKMERPKHFLSPYHPDYNSGASYDDLDNMLYGQDWLAHVPGYPCLHAWCLESAVTHESRPWVRNPYYWKVDTEGNQLPYIDYIEAELIDDSGVRLLNLAQGTYEASFRGTDDPNDFAFLEANAVSGDYQVWPGAVNGAGAWPGWIVNQNFNDSEAYPTNWEDIGDLLRDQNFRQGLSHAMSREDMIQAVWDGDGTAQQATISPQSWHFDSTEGQAVYQDWATSYITYNTSLAESLFTAANFVDQDDDDWRDLPDGTPFTLTLDMGDWGGAQVSISATQELQTQLEAIGIRIAVNDLIGSPDWGDRQTEGLYMLRNCHVSELDLWTYPDWVFPVRDKSAWPMEGKWYQTGGAEGWEPQSGSPAYDLLALYRQGLAEPDEAKRHEIIWDAIDIHIQEGPFTIGASGATSLCQLWCGTASVASLRK